MTKNIIIFFLLLSNILLADTLSIDSKKFVFDQFNILKLIDSSNKLSIKDVKDIEFKTQVTNSYSNGFLTHQSIWHKFSIKNNLSEKAEFIFHDEKYYLAAELDFFVLNSEGDIIYSHYGGFNRTDHKKLNTTKSLSFYRTSIEPNQTYTFLIKTYFESGNSGLYHYKIEDLDTHIYYGLYDNIFQAFLLGGILVLILYNLFIYSYTKDSIYIYYVSYLFFSFVIGFVFMSGFAFKFFDLSQNTWIHKATYATPLTLMFIMIFTSKIFEMKKYYPKLHKYFSLSIYFVAAYIVLSVIFGLLEYLPFIMVFAMIMGFVLVFIGIYMTYKKNLLGIVYLVSTAIYAAFAVITIIYYLGYLPTNLFTSNTLMIGSLIEGIGLSLLLAYRINVLKKQNSSLELLSSTDGLTNLYNRRHFNEVAPRELNRAKRDKRIYAFTLLDIDNFKKYNDTYGHQEGDKVLIQVAKTLKNSFKRSHDIVFRLGGEEFGVIFSAKTVDEVKVLVERARENIEALNIEHKLNEPSNVVTASFGLVMSKMDSFKSEINMDNLYKDVDTLLYEAKAEGRNQVRSKVF
ncbi:diguanylate cyclase [Sulfurimonas sp.]|uniref:diguanylate cyclase n=1 Tax=Sulfurimonas sp. TaxID=2022749 RepID=UPI00356B4FF1